MTKVFEAQFEYCLMPDPSLSSSTALTHYDYTNAFVPMQGFGVIRGVTNNSFFSAIPGFPTQAPNGMGYNTLIVNNANAGMGIQLTNANTGGVASNVMMTCGPYGTISIPAEWWMSNTSYEVTQLNSAGILNPILTNWTSAPYTIPLNFDIFFWQ